MNNLEPLFHRYVELVEFLTTENKLNIFKNFETKNRRF